MTNIISHTECMDCVEAMRIYPDKFFDLAICDPPYGIGQNGSRNHTRSSRIAKSHDYKGFSGGDKSIPNAEYFEELFRVSKNQIIWGGNYMVEHLPPSMGWIFWDKDCQNDFSDGEFAFTSFKRAAKRFKYTWAGFRQGPKSQSIEKRIHPTQKPVALYAWLLDNYAKEGDTILDTHLGSGSSRIAAFKKGFDFYGFELDEHYFDLQQKRFQTETAMPLFDNVL